MNLSMKTVEHGKGILVGIALLLTLLFCVACGESDPAKESYKEAVKLYKAGNYYDAANLFDSIDYKDSQEKADECYFLVQKDGLQHLSAGDIVKFGYYEQDNNEENGKEEIEWIVVEADDSKASMISKYSLDYQKYNSFFGEITWGECSLRTWLNDSFYNDAFGAIHQKMIEEAMVIDDETDNITYDRVFLPSLQEAEYIFGPRQDSEIRGAACYPTNYAASKGAGDYDGWWTRTSGYYPEYATFLDSYGIILGSKVNDFQYVRPAIVINTSIDLP